MKKWWYSLLALAIVLSCLLVLPTKTEAATYTVGYGVSIPNGNVPADGTNKYCNCGFPVGNWGHWCCWYYGYYSYYHIWGVYPNRYDNSTHYLRNLSASERTFTAEHLRMYLKDAAPGALLRIDTDPTPSAGDNNGHTLIFVQMNGSGNGALFLEGNYDGCGRTRLVEWDFNYLVSQYGHYTYIKYISWPNAPEYTAVSYATIAEGKYTLKSSATGTYAAVEGNADVVGQNILTTKDCAGFEIKKSTTTEGYSIRPLCSAGGRMNVYTEYVTSGNNVCLWEDTGHASQRWYFEAVSGGYVIRSVQTPSCALTVDGNGNIYVSTYTGAASQIWKVEPLCSSHKYSAVTCTKAKTCTVCGVTSGKALGHSYTNACDTTCNRSGCKATRTVTHSYAAATCTKAKTCKVCGVTSGKALGHNYQSGSCIRCAHTPTKVKITAQPKSVRVPSGKTAKVTVKAVGDGLKYVWYYKPAGATGYATDSFTSATYTVKMSSAVNGQYVYCVVYDKYGNSVQSKTVRIYQGNPAKITAQPVNAVVKSGKTAKVTVKATGDGLKYTWYYAKKGSSKFKKASVTSATYSVKMSSSVDGRKVYCVITDQYGTSVKTKTVTLYKGTPVKLTTQPKNVTVVSGKTGKLTVKASGSGLKYQWYVKYKGASGFTKVGSSSKTYSFKMASKLNGAQAYCVVKDKFGFSVKSSVVTIKQAPKVKITAQPQSVAVAKNKTAKVTVKASGDGLKYTWYYAKKGSSKFTKSSVKSAAYSVKMTSAIDGRRVYCVIKDKYGNSVKSSTVTLNIKSTLKITKQPTSAYAVSGSTVKVTVKASGDGLKYTWYYANRWAEKWTKSSVTSATYSVKMSSEVNYRTVYCVVKDKYGNTVKSKTAILFNIDHIDKVAGTWISMDDSYSDGEGGVNYDCGAEIDPDGSAFVCVPGRVTMSTSIEFVKKKGNKYYYQMMEGPEYLQYNSTAYDDGLVDVIYDASTGSLEMQFDYGYTVFFERGER